jgi:Haloacid dehalogenase-like hydrolase
MSCANYAPHFWLDGSSPGIDRQCQPAHKKWLLRNACRNAALMGDPKNRRTAFERDGVNVSQETFAAKHFARTIERVTELLRGLADLEDGYDVILCDVWGVLHNGLTAFQKAAEALSRFRAKGGKVVLMTNSPNPSRIVVA